VVTAREPITARVHASIAEIPRDSWNALFPAAQQSWDYYRAAERMSARGFTFSAIGAYAGDTLVGAVPLFRVDYRLDSSIDGWAKNISDWVNRAVPSLLTMPVLGLGSPIAEECEFGFTPGASEQDRIAILNALLKAMSQYARQSSVQVLAM